MTAGVFLVLVCHASGGTKASIPKVHNPIIADSKLIIALVVSVLPSLVYIREGHNHSIK